MGEWVHKGTRMSGSVLTRYSNSALFVSSTSFQSQVDEIVGHFIEEATDPKLLASMAVGGLAYQFGKIGVMGLRVGAYGHTPLRVASIAVGLGSEVTAFEFTNRILYTIRATGQSPLQESNPNLWSWSGPGGWKQGLLSSLITFGMLKSAGFVAREQNLILQHTFQSSAMVLGHQTAGLFGVLPKPSGTLSEQFLHAEATNLSMGVGMSLARSIAPGLHAWERGLDLSLKGIAPSWHFSEGSNQLDPLPVAVEGNSLLSWGETKKGLPILMSVSDGAGGGGNGKNERETLPLIFQPESGSTRVFNSLAIELGVNVSPNEMITTLSGETQRAFRGRVMDLISTTRVASRLSPSHLNALRNFVIGGELLPSQLLSPLVELIQAGRDGDLVGPPSDSTPTLPPPEPRVDGSLKTLQTHEQILEISPNLPGRPRQVEKTVLLPGLGEVSAFTEARGKPDKNEDAFGIGGNGIFLIASGAHPERGEGASALAVQSVLERMTGSDTPLGNAFLEADARIRLQGGETFAGAIRINPDGTVDTAMSGNMGIWILFWDGEANYGIVPFVIPDENTPKTALGARIFPLPNLVEKAPPAGPGEILIGQIPFPRSSGSQGPTVPLKLREGDGVLMMSAGLAKYYQERPAYQLVNLAQNEKTAEGIRTAIQKDSLGRLETLKWRRGLKFEGQRVPTLLRARIPVGMPMEGDYIDSVGDVYDAEEDGNLIANFGEQENHTALVYLHRPPADPHSLEIAQEEVLGASQEESDIEDPFFQKSPPTEEISTLPNIPSDQPPPDSLSKVGAYLESAQSVKKIIRYPAARTLEEFILKYGKNIHAGGIFLKTLSPEPVGAFVELEIRIADGDLILKGEGQVSWIRSSRGSSLKLPPGMGITFLGLDPESEIILKKILAEKK